MDQNLIDILNRNKINFRVFEHPPVFTVEQAKNTYELKDIPGIRTKNLFLKDERDNYYLVCLRGDKRLNMKHLEKSLTTKHLKFATAEELKRHLNLTPGSVSIFGMIYSKKVLLIIDKESFESEAISFHPNINTHTLVLDNDNLVRFLNTCKINYKVIDLL